MANEQRFYETGARAVVARHEVEYLKPMAWSPDLILVEVRVSRVGRSNFDVCQQVRSPAGAENVIYARALSSIVCLDPTSQAPTELSEVDRNELRQLHELPLVFRHTSPGG
jgi:acyl-CoA thioester hydrolase